MARKKTGTESAAAESRAMEQRVLAFAEQLGRMVGTLERKTTGWLDIAALNEQVTRIRDGAADLLGHIGRGDGAKPGQPVDGDDSSSATPAPDSRSRTASGAEPKVRRRKSSSSPHSAAAGASATRPSQSRAESGSAGSREHVAAPGKKHRKPPASVAGASHSDEEIPNAATGRSRRTRGR